MSAPIVEELSLRLMEGIIHPWISKIYNQGFAGGFADQITDKKARPGWTCGKNNVQLMFLNYFFPFQVSRKDPGSSLIRKVTKVVNKVFKSLQPANINFTVRGCGFEYRLATIGAFNIFFVSIGV